MDLQARAGRPIRVFAHLAYGFGAERWEALWRAKRLIGINDRLAYGYFHAEAFGCEVGQSADARESRLGKLARLALRLVLGFDLVHAWRNRTGIISAEVVWTHTESQFLAVLLLLEIVRPKVRPKLIAQSVWLFDGWEGFSAVRRFAYARLIAKADILTVHSPLNLEVARRLFPNKRCELILYGIRADQQVTPEPRTSGGPFRILSLGNDEHRDWALLVSVVAARPDWRLTIVSRTIDASLLGRAPNVVRGDVANNDDLFRMYAEADLLVLALKPNLHASGITVLQEAALRGVPILCSDTGGLRAYFGDESVRYVPPGNAGALTAGIEAYASGQIDALASARRAQARMGPDGLSSISFARRHAQISAELVGRPLSATAGSGGRERAMAQVGMSAS